MKGRWFSSRSFYNFFFSFTIFLSGVFFFFFFSFEVTTKLFLPEMVIHPIAQKRKKKTPYALYNRFDLGTYICVGILENDFRTENID